MRSVVLFLIVAVSSIPSSCSANITPKVPTLPDQPPRWVEGITLSGDSNPRFIGHTTDLLITSVSPGARTITPRPASISVGSTHEGLTLGAIKCDFMTKDGSYAGERLMWRGRWSCMGRTKPARSGKRG